MADRIFEDTTDFFSIENGDEIKIRERRYKVIGHARESRFGLDDPKFWVKRVIDTETNERKIIKLEYFENFELKLGGIKIKCFRDPAKEGKILNLVKDNPYFMQGNFFYDKKGNNVRILDVIRGTNFLSYIHSLNMTYESYFQNVLPGILKKLVRSLDAIRFLHTNGYRHGDIRNDHLIIDGRTGIFVWIDFDYDFVAPENPFSLDIYGLGNILLYAIGKGFHDIYTISNNKTKYENIVNSLESDDFSLLDKTRFINLRKVFPFIPIALNNILMHFSRGAGVYYETVDEIIEDLNRCLQEFYA